MTASAKQILPTDLSTNIEALKVMMRCTLLGRAWLTWVTLDPIDLVILSAPVRDRWMTLSLIRRMLPLWTTECCLVDLSEMCVILVRAMTRFRLEWVIGRVVKLLGAEQVWSTWMAKLCASDLTCLVGSLMPLWCSVVAMLVMASLCVVSLPGLS